MPTDFIQQLVAFGLAALGAVAPAPAVETSTASSGESTQAITVAYDEAPSESRIDPALLNNPTLRRAIATVGPDLIADPEVRAAIRAGRFDESLMNNPTVSRAMMRVGPSLLADPQLSAAVRSGELGPEMLNDPAVIAILRGLDPTIFDEPRDPSVVVTAAPMPLPPIAEPPAPTDDVDPVIAEVSVAEVSVAEAHSAETRRAEARARRQARIERLEARRAANAARRGPIEAPRAIPGERSADVQVDLERVANGLLGIALHFAQNAAANGR